MPERLTAPVVEGMTPGEFTGLRLNAMAEYLEASRCMNRALDYLISIGEDTSETVDAIQKINAESRRLFG